MHRLYSCVHLYSIAIVITAFLHSGGLDYRPLVAGSFDGDDVNLDHPNFQGCAQLILLNDDLVEGTETLQLSLVTDDAANGFINANFIFDPSVTEVCILDDDQCK